MNVGHPALITVLLLKPNHQENKQNPDQRPDQKELAHKTALCLSGIRTLPVGTSGYKQDRGDQREAGEYLGTCRALINRTCARFTGTFSASAYVELLADARLIVECFVYTWFAKNGARAVRGLT